MPDYTLRAARPNDLPQLIDLYIQLNPINSDLPDEATLTEVLDDILTNKNLYCVVAATPDDQLLGTCTLAVIPNLTHGARPFAVIENVVTHRDRRGRGIGAALIRHVLSAAWETGCYKVMLMSGASRTEAHRFYEKLGFVSDTKVGFVATPESAPGDSPADQT